MKKLRLAVTGLRQAGKTVFLTSMINFLLENGSKHSALFRRKGLMVSAKELPPDSSVARFPYEDYLGRFKKKPPEWPEPTNELTEFHLKLILRKGNRRTKEYGLELVDYPGERIMDLPLWGKTYESWSDETDRESACGIRGHLRREFRQSCMTLSDSSPKNAAQKKSAVECYKDYLSKCKNKGLNFLQPSKMLLEDSGAENLTFCPLPRKVRKSAPSIAAEFKKEYKAYKKRNIRNFAREITICSRQIVLVDILQILKNGVHVYNDARKCFDSILDMYRYKKKHSWFMNLIVRSFPFKKVNIDRVAFVATKADQATRNNRQNMKALLEKLVERKHDYLKYDRDANVGFFFAAAHRSTKDIKVNLKGIWREQGKSVSALAGRLKKDPGKEREIFPGEMPDEWPGEWNPEEKAYRFSDFAPRVLPARNGAIFDHINLDEVLLYMFEDLVR